MQELEGFQIGPQSRMGAMMSCEHEATAVTRQGGEDGRKKDTEDPAARAWHKTQTRSWLGIGRRNEG